MKSTFRLLCAISFACFSLAPAFAQAYQGQPPQGGLGQLLDRIDPPAMAPQQLNVQTNNFQQQNQNAGQQLQPVPANVANSPNYARVPSAPQQQQQNQGQPVNGQAQAAAPAQPQSVFGKVFQTFFGGSDSPDASDNANRAKEQAGYARSAYERSFYGSYDTRSGAADEAYYAAEAARNEADAAYNKTASGNPTAQSNASKARAYADQAQSYADKARGNADSKW